MPETPSESYKSVDRSGFRKTVMGSGSHWPIEEVAIHMTNHGKVRKLRDCIVRFSNSDRRNSRKPLLVSGANLPRNEEEVNLLYDS